MLSLCPGYKSKTGHSWKIHFPAFQLKPGGSGSLLWYDVASYELRGNVPYFPVWTKHQLLIMLPGITLRPSEIPLRNFKAMQMFQCPWSLWWCYERKVSCYQSIYLKKKKPFSCSTTKVMFFSLRNLTWTAPKMPEYVFF